MTNRPYINLPHTNGPIQSVHESFPLHEVNPEAYDALGDFHNHLLGLEKIIYPEPVRQAEMPFAPDGELDITIFPLTDEGDARKGSTDGHRRGPKQQVRTLQLLHDLKDMWGNDSEVLGFRFRRDGSTDYQIVLLRDEEGEVEAAVVETEKTDNAAYVWQRRASDASDWRVVFNKTKGHAQKNQAVQLRHRTRGVAEKVLTLLTMPDDALLDRVTRIPAGKV